MLALTPLLVPLMTALLCVLMQAHPRWQQRVSLAGAFVLLGCAIALLQQVQQYGAVRVAAGNWPLPFAIEFAADRLSAALVLIAALMVTVTVVWQWSDADAAPSTPALHPLLHGLVAGAGAAFVTADLFNLYVWFEVALICSLGLLAQGGALRNLDATLKYFVLNVFGTVLFLAAVALLFAATGHLNFTALGEATARLDAAVALPLIGLLTLAFLIKAAAFPFFAWLPASYHTLPAPVLALFAALLTKIGVYALIRMLGDVLHPAPPLLFDALGWIAVLSMVTGVLGAAYHWDMRRILAFHSISQIGYILLAISLATRAGDTAAIFFTLHHSVVKAGLFLVVALVFRCTGHYDLRRIGGLYAARPGLGVVFLLLALALVGIPPFSGFWGKYLIVREALRQSEYVWAACALLVGVVTLYSMMKIWLEAFWKPHPDPAWQPPAAARVTPAWMGVGALVIVTLWAGLWPDTMITFATDAASALRGGAP
jgi:multicomponent Na+:H+ antiporter subunit D